MTNLQSKFQTRTIFHQQYKVNFLVHKARKVISTITTKMIITCSPFKFVKYNRPCHEAQQYLRKFPQCINYKIIERNISKLHFPLVLYDICTRWF